MFCSNCGREIDNRAAVCIHCGTPVGRFYQKPEDAPSGGFAAIGFFIPLVGLILYLVYHDTRPLRAKSAGKGALIGFITKLVLYIVLMILNIFLFTGMSNDLTANGHPATIERYSEDKTENILENSLDVNIGKFIVEKGDYYDKTTLSVTVKNKSQSRHSFFIKLEAVDKTGARLDTDMIYVTDLNSGQEMHLEAFKYVAQDKIPEFKGATFKVLEVLMY